jgi:hypothetical protein
MNIQFTLDKTAIGLSVLCAVHCLVLPVFAVLAPTSISFVLADEAFHQWLVWGIVPISVLALAIGCRKHQRYLVFAYGAVGIFILGLTAYLGHDLLGEIAEKILTLAGVIVIALGHVRNYQLCRKQKCECPSSSKSGVNGEWSLN